jgi:hypothetical protein
MTVVVTGYGGTFRATVVDDADPMQQSRLQVVVPDVYGDSVPVWAVASRTDDSSGSPAIGDLVWVSFEHGDTDYPVWQADQGADQGVPPAGGYVGKYRAVVVDNMDPQQERRLEVTGARRLRLPGVGDARCRRQPVRRSAGDRLRGVDRVRVR